MLEPFSEYAGVSPHPSEAVSWVRKRIAYFVDLFGRRIGSVVTDPQVGRTTNWDMKGRVLEARSLFQSSANDIVSALNGEPVSKAGISRIAHLLCRPEIQAEFPSFSEFLTIIKRQPERHANTSEDGSFDSCACDTAEMACETIAKSVRRSPEFPGWLKEQEWDEGNVLLSTPFGIVTDEGICMYQGVYPSLHSSEEFLINGKKCYRFEVHEGGQWTDTEVRNARWKTLRLPTHDGKLCRVVNISRTGKYLVVTIDENAKWNLIDYRVDSDGVLRVRHRVSFFRRIFDLG